MTDDSVFWQEARQNRLTFQHCDTCGFVRWPAAGTCPECLGRTCTWKPVEPTGTVWSYVVYHRAYTDSVRNQVPYNVALVELDCGVRLVTRLVGFESEDAMGCRVEARFEEVNGEGPVPVFARPGTP